MRTMAKNPIRIVTCAVAFAIAISACGSAPNVVSSASGAEDGQLASTGPGSAFPSGLERLPGTAVLVVSIDGEPLDGAMAFAWDGRLIVNYRDACESGEAILTGTAQDLRVSTVSTFDDDVIFPDPSEVCTRPIAEFFETRDSIGIRVSSDGVNLLSSDALIETAFWQSHSIHNEPFDIQSGPATTIARATTTTIAPETTVPPETTVLVAPTDQ